VKKQNVIALRVDNVASIASADNCRRRNVFANLPASSSS